MIKILILIIVAVIIFPANVFAMMGATYPIIEPNLITEIQVGAKKMEQEMNEHPKTVRKILRKKIYAYTPTHTLLPLSNHSYIYYYDVIYTLPFSIPKVKDGNVVGTLYPKGFTFHVLKYMPFDFPTLVIFSLKNKYERFYIEKKYGYKENPEAMLLTTEGNLKNILHLSKHMKKPVYANVGKLDQRFGIKNTLSIVKRSVSNLNDLKIKVIGRNYLIKFYTEFHKKTKK